MSFIFRTILLGLAFLLAGCGQPAVAPSESSESVKSALQSIGGVDVQLDHYPSYAEYNEVVYRQLKAIVEKVPSATELKTLFMECHRRWKVTPDAPQNRLQWLDPHSETLNVIIHRLADLNSEESAKALVELYADKTIVLDGGFSLDICNAITRCGTRALPHLTKLDFGDRKERVQLLISYIEKGQLYGP